MTATTALRSEHDHILSMIACLRAACAAAENGDRFDAETFQTGLDFIRNYADAWHHAKEKENGILFNMADQILLPEDHTRLEKDYQTAIPSGATAETGAHYEGIVATLCQQWNVDPREAASVGANFQCG